MKRHTYKKSPSNELGFGQKAYGRETRLITTTGEYNVRKKGMRFWESLDVYHELIAMKWGLFIFWVTTSFFIVNTLFALLYFWAGVEGISGANLQSQTTRFLSAFFFSTQTITTVGYGAMSPQSYLISSMAAVEAFIGFLGFAIATGLLFARFSRPRKNLVYSKHAVIAPYRSINALMFRFINKSKNQLAEAEVEMAISYWSESDKRRIFKTVDLEIRRINFFSTNWTVVHPINQKSPLFEWEKQDLSERQVEIIIWFKAYDDTYVRQIYDRVSYVAEEVKWGEKFVPMYEGTNNRKIYINMEMLSETEKASLN